MFNDTFNNISVKSWRSVLLVDQNRSTWRKKRHVTSHNVVSSTPGHERESN